MIKDILLSICLLSDKSINEIESLLQEEQVKKGETFIELNKRETKEYFVLNGVCRSYLINPEGEEITISFFTSNSVLSPYTTRTNRGMSMLNFQAVTKVEILSIDAFQFEKLMIDNLEIRNFGITNISLSRLRKELAR